MWNLYFFSIEVVLAVGQLQDVRTLYKESKTKAWAETWGLLKKNYLVFIKNKFLSVVGFCFGKLFNKKILRIKRAAPENA